MNKEMLTPFVATHPGEMIKDELKERKMTQKKVAEELGVSQALLSHYEKNIRECGLDFVVRMSEYYDVSCDFLLGVTEERGNCKKNPPLPPVKVKENHVPKCIQSSLNIVFGIAKKINSKSLSRFILNYLSYYLKLFK